MTSFAKSAKTHPAAKKCCDWEERAIYVILYKPLTLQDCSDLDFGFKVFPLVIYEVILFLCVYAILSMIPDPIIHIW